MSPKPSMLQPALIGGVALGVTSAIPVIGLLNCLCCALVIGGAILAVYLYSKDYPSDLPAITHGDGAIVGALAGAIGGAVEVVVGLFVGLAFAGAGVGMGKALEALEQLDIDLPPQLTSMMAASAIGVLGALLTLPLYVIVGAIAGALGGVIGVAIFGDRKVPPPPATQATPPAPPAPPAPPIASSEGYAATPPETAPPVPDESDDSEKDEEGS